MAESDLIEMECGCLIRQIDDEDVVQECDSHAMHCCMDCEKHESEFDEYYMVKNEIWASVVFPSEWYMLLCIDCLESRLGRYLRREDFMNVEVNDYNHCKQHSWKQQWRLGYIG